MKNFLFSTLALLLACNSIAQTPYYVSTSGNDNNTGLSIAQGWKTIQHAMDNASVNSIVNILAGTYNEKVEVNVSGTLGNPIIFQNYNSDEVIISGTGVGGLDAIIGVFDQSFIIIKGLNIQDNAQLDAQGIIVEGDCQNIEIRNNTVQNIHFSTNPNAAINENTNSQPIIVFGSNANNSIKNLIIDGNTVRNSRTGFSEGLAVNGNVDGFEITNNIVHNITNIGIDIIGHEGTASANDQARNGLIKSNIVYNCLSPYATAAGIYVDGAMDLVIEKNIVYKCQWGIEIGCENINKTTSGIYVRNNLIYENDDAAIALGGYDFPSNSGKVIDCFLTNNTCYNNDTKTASVGGITGELNLTYTENCTLENNIFYATNTSDIILYVDNVNSINLNLNYNQFYISGNMEFDYEGTTYSSFNNYQTGTNQDLNSIFSDPLFNDISTPDLHLTASSPSRDMGNPTYISAIGETDIDGDIRIQNNTIDIGADEYNTTAAAHIITAPSNISIYPNPFTDKVILEGDFTNYQIKIYDVFGNLITDYSQASSPLTIDLDSLGNGLYFISVQHDAQSQLSVYKIIKQ